MADLPWNIMVMALCYGYIVTLILIADSLPTPKPLNRKILHALIGNLPFLMPLFTDRIYPFLVAAPFIAVTFLASPANPFNVPLLDGLRELTEEGHNWGLVMYSVSYTILAFLYGNRPFVVAAGILPMAYGDSLAALVGTRFGKHRFKVTESKSLEGSAAMFLGSFLSLLVAFFYFRALYPGASIDPFGQALCISLIVTVVEAAAPRGVDNVLVPGVGSILFILLSGGF